MIVIERKGALDVIVEGHANSDVYGHDLVCAAVSALVLALEINVEDMGRKGRLDRSLIRLDPGYVRIRCTPRAGRNAETVEVFDTICLGFQALAEKFGKYVVYLAQ